MKNILSYQPGTKFSGQEILNWANYQVENHTSHWKQGGYVLYRFGNLSPIRMYTICLPREYALHEHTVSYQRHRIVINRAF